MSEGLNRVLLLGNLGADPELRVTQGGEAILKLRLATTENYLDRNNARQERTEWHQITMWGKRGEALAKFLQKGDRLFVEGRIQTSSYEKDGEKRYRTEVVATNVILNGGNGNGASQSNGNGRTEQQRRDQRRERPPTQRGRAAAPPREPGDDFDAFDEAGDDDPF